MSCLVATGRHASAVALSVRADHAAATMLSQSPDNLGVLLAKTGIMLQTDHAAEAIPLLNQILARTNSVAARLNRAVAYLQTGNYSGAKVDCLDLQKNDINPYYANYGLAQVALHQNQIGLAEKYLRLCLANLPPKSPQAVKVKALLNELSRKNGR